MNFYEVKVKCGHVGKGKYIPKTLYIAAESGKLAASIARQTPRVKHHKKDAILNVKEITFEIFNSGKCANREDSYFSVHSSSAQRAINAVNEEDIVKEPTLEKKKVKDKKVKLLKNKILEEEAIKEMRKCEVMYG